MKSTSAPKSHENRLDAFANVQYDPEVWELVQKKFHQFENLNKELDAQQNHRRDLLRKLDDVNSQIARLQDELVGLSGKEKVAALAEETEKPDHAGTEAEDAPDEALFNLRDEEEPEDDNGPIVGLAPIKDEDEDEPVESLMAWPDVAPADQPDQAPEATAEEAQAAAEGPAAQEVEYTEADAPESVADLEPYEPVTEEPAETPVAEAQAEPAPAQEEPKVQAEEAKPEEAKPEEKIEIPGEVAELQKIFDGADDQRRQSDSALKLVQLYDGKAEVFFTAMCRSHQQNGLNQADARKEAVKDVQTMIATASSHSQKGSEKKNGASGNPVRRLFSH